LRFKGSVGTSGARGGGSTMSRCSPDLEGRGGGCVCRRRRARPAIYSQIGRISEREGSGDGLARAVGKNRRGRRFSHGRAGSVARAAAWRVYRVPGRGVRGRRGLARDAWGGAGQLTGEANRRRPTGGENQWRRRRPWFQPRKKKKLVRQG
jgi:hypothetical protein